MFSHRLQMVGQLRMSLNMMHIMGFFISWNMYFFFSLYHFEHIYLIHGKIGHIIIWPCAMGAQVRYHIVYTMILLMFLKPHDLTFGSVVCNDY
jgi:hypothetical protein